jgi:hypothetical protein
MIVCWLEQQACGENGDARSARNLLSRWHEVWMAGESMRHLPLPVSHLGPLAATSSTPPSLERSEQRWWVRVPASGAALLERDAGPSVVGELVDLSFGGIAIRGPALAPSTAVEIEIDLGSSRWLSLPAHATNRRIGRDGQMVTGLELEPTVADLHDRVRAIVRAVRVQPVVVALDPAASGILARALAPLPIRILEARSPLEVFYWVQRAPVDLVVARQDSAGPSVKVLLEVVSQLCPGIVGVLAGAEDVGDPGEAGSPRGNELIDRVQSMVSL